MAWAVAADVTGAWIGGDYPADTAQIDEWIAKAERYVRKQVPDLQARIDAEAELPEPSTETLELAKDVIVAMVTRVFRNPDGRRSTQTTTGPFTENITFGGDQPGGLMLTSEELSMLTGFSAGQRAFSIDMMPSVSPYSPFYLPDGGF